MGLFDRAPRGPMIDEDTDEDFDSLELATGPATIRRRVGQSERPPEPSFWPTGSNNREETGPIGAGTPHARMEWFWERMKPHKPLIEELTGWSPVSSTYRFEAAIADAFDKLAKERG